jgi:hypothetical protein
MLPASIWTLGWRSHSPTGAALPGTGSCCVTSAHEKTPFNTYGGQPPPTVNYEKPYSSRSENGSNYHFLSLGVCKPMEARTGKVCWGMIETVQVRQ